METAYTLNTSGDVTRTETTRHEGGQAKKTTVEHSIDAGGRLTAVTTDGDKRAQTWDAAGNLLTDHRGTVWTYNTRNQPLTATSPDGTVTAYTYWADGTRRDTVTTGKDGTTTRSGFYYTPDGTITNDTHTAAKGNSDDGSGGGRGGGDPVTASYLSAATREARTLTGGTDSESGGTAAGAGYLLHDRHGSTTALATTDQNAAVTAAWNYDDYGRHTTTNGTPLTTNAGEGAAAEGSSAAATAGGTAAVNPFTYSGEHTDTRLGTQYLKNRIYDTSQGRFTTRDTAPLHNRYQYAETNPITNTDPTGNTAVLDKIVSGVMIGVTILMAVVTVAITAITAGIGTALGIALAGAVLDTASAAVETAAWATGNNQWDSPLNIAAYTLGAAGLALGGIGAAIGAGAKGIKGIGKSGRPSVIADTGGGETPVPRPTVEPDLFPMKKRKDGVTHRIDVSQLPPELRDEGVRRNFADKMLHHGTGSKYAESIRQNGLQLKHFKTGYFGRGNYTSPQRKVAADYAGPSGKVLNFRLTPEAKVAKLYFYNSGDFILYHTWKDVPRTAPEYTGVAWGLDKWVADQGYNAYQVRNALGTPGQKFFITLQDDLLSKPV
ncbi:RHS repeat-associated core domain-containing protein [Streptomyces sp. NPDC057910]|uniref:RHS repeat-associated core domain-containing protein n=1 Tax=Streptomyces sp. NPDC057910 TaxID=3346278 RepID=UPI0036E60656